MMKETLSKTETVEQPEAEAGSSATLCSAPVVLDMCCGPRMMWFDKKDSRAVYLDKRRECHEIARPKRNTVEFTETAPDVLGDFTNLPFPDESFLHVVFDPPHFERDNPGSFMAKKYGTLSAGWRDMLRDGFREGFRVLKPGGTLIFKWTATENPIREVLKLTPEKPLYGHKSGKQQQTHWVAFLKQNDQGDSRSPAKNL